MKKLRLLTILACCASAFAFMSCNTGDTTAWTPLTPSEKASCFAQVTGTYNGKMAFYSEDSKANASDVTDTLDVKWTIGTGTGADTTVTVTNFPVSILHKYIPEEKVSKALAVYEGTVALKSPMYFYQSTPAPAFLLQPEVIRCPISYDGGAHTISLYFYQSYVSAITSYGFYNSTKNTLRMSFLFGGYKLDSTDDSSTGMKQASYTINGRSYSYAPLEFSGQK